MKKQEILNILNVLDGLQFRVYESTRLIEKAYEGNKIIEFYLEPMRGWITATFSFIEYLRKQLDKEESDGNMRNSQNDQ